jgi:Protein of unknown function (DUF1553)/Protein of unknown function (DUF1549)/Planctomycete cytochrome C
MLSFSCESIPSRWQWLAGLLLVLPVFSDCAFGQSASTVDFDKSIAPILIERCLECHGPIDANGNFNISSHATMNAGGDSGPAIDSGKSESSLLFQRVMAGEMPPEKNGASQKLTDSEIELLKSWIDSGAKWPDNRQLDPYERTTAKRGGRDWWSLQPITRPQVDGANAIDELLDRVRNQRGVTKAPQADRRALIRRLYFDLIGLPPTADEIDAFVADTSHNAYEKVVDRLLASQHFGEKWARHWMDVVRYAETNGYERDAVKPDAWRYRDWVISALNSDMPYDQFVIEQLAGDEIEGRSESSVIATGFLRLGTWDDEPNGPAEYQYERLEDLVHVTTTAFLGWTVKCARCHDHKFDPIPQTDYYRVAATFWPGPVAHRQRELLGGPSPEELGYKVLGWTDITRTPSPLHLLKKGNINRPGPEVAPGSLTTVGKNVQDFSPSPEYAKTTQRRLQLAQWIANPENPLTSRVIVNRLWQHHFGEGIVRSSDNFGFTGQRPTFPELLDWLASELVQGGWKMKRIHKLIVMSDAYRQSSQHPLQHEYADIDANNHFLWRYDRRRLNAEALRDAILMTSGQLDIKAGGPSFMAPISEEALEGLSMKSGAYQASPATETRRRSVYMFAKRALGVPLMTAFDVCDSASPTGRRDVTIVAPQALALMNNQWVNEQSTAFAERVLAGAESDEDRVRLAWRLALSRNPSEAEQQAAVRHLAEMRGESNDDTAYRRAWTSLCHVLFNTNEFIYVD